MDYIYCNEFEKDADFGMGMTLGVIGAGNMAGAILNGILTSGLMEPSQIYVSNRHGEKLEPWKAKGLFTTTDNREVARQANLLLLAVKPQILKDVLPEISGLASGKCVISIAAGISSSYLKKELPGCHVVAAMPNTPLLLGKGATAIALRPIDVPQEEYDEVVRIFSAAGAVAFVEEAQLNAIIPVNGSSPAFFFRMAEIMVELAKERGIDEKMALTLTARTMEGAAAMLLDSGKTPTELTKQVCSPGGTTLAALTAFEEGGFEQMLREAFDRCIHRAEELGR